MLAEELRDPDIVVRTSLRCSPERNPVQRQAFARAYLDADRPGDALVWLQDSWPHLDDSSQDLAADALERLGRFEKSSPIRLWTFQRAVSDLRLEHWLQHLPEATRLEAIVRLGTSSSPLHRYSRDDSSQVCVDQDPKRSLAAIATARTLNAALSLARASLPFRVRAEGDTGRRL